MKRDMDLIRSILLYSEHNCVGLRSCTVTVDDFEETKSKETLMAHINMLREIGLLGEGRRAIGIISIGNLTWHGHDFLDSVRNPEIWRKTKDAAEKAGGFTFSILGEIAKGLIKTQVEKHTGVEL